MEKEFLYELMAEFEKRDIHELSVESEELSIYLAKAPPQVAPQVVSPPATPVLHSAEKQSDSADTSAQPAESASGTEWITAPAVGTFYRQPAPDAPNFVSEGDTVKKGQTLCILEAMKLMNELPAEFDCEIVKALVDNGTMVAYNDPLFEVKRL